MSGDLPVCNQWREGSRGRTLSVREEEYLPSLFPGDRRVCVEGGDRDRCPPVHEGEGSCMSRCPSGW